MKTSLANLSTILIILGLMSGYLCNLQKISFVSLPNKITAIQVCKTFNSVIFTTDNGFVHQWVGFTKTNDYQVGGTSHQITCSRYSEDQQHAYIGILTNNGQVKMMEEIYQSFAPTASYLQFVPITIRRQEPASDLSIGLNYVAVGYKNISTIDIYHIPDPNSQPYSLKLQNPWNTIRMDLFDNLAVATSINSVVKFDYYLNRILKRTITINQTLANGTIELDYKFQVENQIDSPDYRTLSYLVVINRVGTYIHYNPFTTGLTAEITQKGAKKLCNNQITNLDQNSIRTEDSQIYVDSINQQILDYACIPQTQSYVQSMYYILSKDDNNYYIDAYDIVSGWIYWIIAGVVVAACCCGCIAGIIKNGGWRDCKQVIIFLCKWSYLILGWCPNEDNLEEIKQSLQR